MKRTYTASQRATPQCVLGRDGPVRGTRQREGDDIIVEADEPAIGVRVLYESASVGKVSLDTPVGDGDGVRCDLIDELHRARAAELADGCAAWGCKTPAIPDDFDELLALSEAIALDVARQAPLRQRGDFRIGCSIPTLDAPAAYLDAFGNMFDLATLRCYWKRFEPRKGECEWQLFGDQVAWCNDRGITAKGHTLVYFEKAIFPDWLDADYSAVRDAACRHITEMVGRFAGTMDIWDVINEAHGSANCLDYSHEQMVDLTVAACAAARAANDRAVLLVNCTDPWGGLRASKAPVTTMQYCRDILAAGADFDVLGLQLYVGPGLGGVRDLFAFSRMLDAYAALGKPIHITEMGVPSSCEPDIAAGRKVTDIAAKGWWHDPWSEAVQAEWVRQFFRVAASKPYLGAMGWWDLADDGKHFHTHGGLLRPDLSAKPAYHMLRDWMR